MEEVWKDIEGYEELYQVSNLGNVKSLFFRRSKNPKLLKPNMYCGYLYVNLCKEGKRLLSSIHRLVAKAFIPNPNNYPVINHKDENKQNNKVDNLEWCTIKYNNNYGTVKERLSKANKGRKFTQEFKDKVSIGLKNSVAAQKQIQKLNATKCKPVGQFNKDTMELIATFPSAREASRQLGINHSSISQCCVGKVYKSVGGFVWKYL